MSHSIQILIYHHSHRKGFTLVEMLVVTGIIVALAAVIAPVGKGLLMRSRAINCSQNLRQIGMATMMYAGDNNMTLPVTTHQRRQGGISWTLALQPYASGDITFKCREDEDQSRGYSYVINDFLTPNPAGAPGLNYSYLSKIERPGSTFMFAEASVNYQNADHFHFSDYYGGRIPPAVFENQVAVLSHKTGANYLFADGHVETLTWLETRNLLLKDGSRFIDPSTP